MKDPKTTIVALICGIVLLIMVLGLVFKKVDLTTFTAVLAATGTFGAAMVGWNAKDSPPPAGQ